MLNKIKHIVVKIFPLIIFLPFVVFLIPSVSYKVGNLFFGEVPILYNVNLSQYIFRYSSNPPLGKSPIFAHYQLSRTYFIKGDFNQAVIEAKKELSLYPDNFRTNYILGLTYGYMDREVEAIHFFTKFIEAKPESWAARNDKAWLQFRIGLIDDALETIDPVKNLANPWVQNTYGTLLLNSNKLIEAREAFLYAKELTDNMGDADWGKSYPGNDPRIYSVGLNAMKKSIETNLIIVDDLINN